MRMCTSDAGGRPSAIRSNDPTTSDQPYLPIFARPKSATRTSEAGYRHAPSGLRSRLRSLGSPDRTEGYAKTAAADPVVGPVLVAHPRPATRGDVVPTAAPVNPDATLRRPHRIVDIRIAVSP